MTVKQYERYAYSHYSPYPNLKFLVSEKSISLGPFVIDRARARHVELGAYLPQKLFLFSGRIFLVASCFLSPYDRLYLLELLPHLGPPPTGLQKMRARFEATLSGVFDAQKFVGHVN